MDTIIEYGVQRAMDRLAGNPESYDPHDLHTALLADIRKALVQRRQTWRARIRASGPMAGVGGGTAAVVWAVLRVLEELSQ